MEYCNIKAFSERGQAYLSIGSFVGLPGPLKFTPDHVKDGSVPRIKNDRFLTILGLTKLRITQLNADVFQQILFY